MINDRYPVERLSGVVGAAMMNVFHAAMLFPDALPSSALRQASCGPWVDGRGGSKGALALATIARITG